MLDCLCWVVVDGGVVDKVAHCKSGFFTVLPLLLYILAV